MGEDSPTIGSPRVRLSDLNEALKAYFFETTAGKTSVLPADKTKGVHMSTIVINFEDLKKMAREYLDALPQLGVDEADNGFKAFTLAYQGCEFPSDLPGRADKEWGAPGLVRIVNREYNNRLFEIAMQGSREKAQVAQ